MFFDEQIRTFLKQARTIAIVGAKDKEGQAVDRVGRYLIEAQYTVYPVHPVRKTVWGLETFPKITAIPYPLDIIVLFRNSQYCPDHARESLALTHKPRIFWMQEGIRSEEAGRLLAEAGIIVIEDLCIKDEHERLLGM